MPLAGCDGPAFCFESKANLSTASDHARTSKELLFCGSMVKEQKILFLKRDSINNSASCSKLIKKVIREFGQTDRENFVVVMLNTKLKPIGANLASIGSINGCMVYPREIKAVLNMPCKALILIHNQPSGNPSPSVEDKLITLMIMASAHLLDVQVLDHLIVDMDSDAYRSLADEKMIEDTKQKVMAIMDQIPNTLAKP